MKTPASVYVEYGPIAIYYTRRNQPKYHFILKVGLNDLKPASSDVHPPLTLKNHCQLNLMKR